MKKYILYIIFCLSFFEGFSQNVRVPQLDTTTRQPIGSFLLKPTSYIYPFKVVNDTTIGLWRYVSVAKIVWTGTLYSGTTTSTFADTTLTLTPSLASQSAYTVLGNHTSGSATPTFGKVNAANEMTGLLLVANGGTGTSTPSIVAGTNITVSGTWPNQIINSSGGGGGGSGGISVIKQTYTSGASVTATDTTTWLIVNPASLQAALTITLAAAPSDKQDIVISFGGTVTSGDVVTTLTISPNSGQTILQSLTPSNVEAGEDIKYRYNATNSKWYRL